MRTKETLISRSPQSPDAEHRMPVEREGRTLATFTNDVEEETRVEGENGSDGQDRQAGPRVSRSDRSE